MKILLLYINGVLAIKTQPLDDEAADLRLANWQRIYGQDVRIEVSPA